MGQPPPHIAFLGLRILHRMQAAALWVFCLTRGSHSLVGKHFAFSVFRMSHKLCAVGRILKWSPRSLPSGVTLVIMFLIIWRKGDYPGGPHLLTWALWKQSFLRLQAEGKVREVSGWEGADGPSWFEDRGGHIRRNAGDFTDLRGALADSQQASTPTTPQKWMPPAAEWAYRRIPPWSFQVGIQPSRHLDFGLLVTQSRELGQASSAWTSGLHNWEIINGYCWKSLSLW